MTGAAVTIAVLSLFRPDRVTVTPAPHTALVMEAGERRIELLPGQKAGLRMEGSEVDVFAGRITSAARTVAVRGRGGEGEFTIAIPGKIERTYQGVLHVSADGAALRLVLTIPSDAAVWAAVAAELSADAPTEARKAMGVAARSFYAASRRRHRDYDFCDTTHCQFFRTRGRAENDGGMRIFYGDNPIPALYSASCGGRTRTAAENGWSSNPYPYFAVDCDPCLRGAKTYEKRLPLRYATRLLRQSEEGRIAINRVLGWNTIPSNNYVVKREETFILVAGRGSGHGAGLCQYGAIEMAKQDKSFTEILRHYFPGTLLK